MFLRFLMKRSPYFLRQAQGTTTTTTKTSEPIQKSSNATSLKKHKREHVSLEYEENSNLVAENKNSDRNAKKIKVNHEENESTKASINTTTTTNNHSSKPNSIKQEEENVKSLQTTNQKDELKKILKEEPTKSENTLEEYSKELTHSKEKKRNEPANWEEVWHFITKMREKRDAPVDSMGCSSLADRTETPQTIRYQTLIGLMLSSQTKDPVTAQAVSNLQQHGLTIDKILETDEETIDSLISKVGFHQKKAKYIKETTKILKTKFKSDIPNTVEGLVSLPGVGPKMAYLAMLTAWNQAVGIGVDVHVHRISNRLRWAKNTKTPEDTRKELEDWLPQEKWSKINKLLVGFGQQVCQPVGPHCASCLVNHLCPSAFKETKEKKPKDFEQIVAQRKKEYLK